MTLALLALVGVLFSTNAVVPEPVCGETVLTDWYDGRIDGTYPPACYREALELLPEDIRIYTSAPDDIARALRARISEEATESPAARDTDAGTATEDEAGASRRLSGRGSTTTEEAERAPPEPAALAADPAATSRRLPLPLLALLALTVALALVGTTSLVARRIRGRTNS